MSYDVWVRFGISGLLKNLYVELIVKISVVMKFHIIGSSCLLLMLYS
jgi:hypothetical protein